MTEETFEQMRARVRTERVCLMGDIGWLVGGMGLGALIARICDIHGATEAAVLFGSGIVAIAMMRPILTFATWIFWLRFDRETRRGRKP